MKPILIAAALLLVPAAAQAQVAAGTMPNTFDRPAAPAAAPARPAPAPAPAALSQTRANATSETTLRTFITGAQAGTLNYAVMSDDLAAQMREQAGPAVQLIQQLGVLQDVRFMGSRGTDDYYAVTFANAQTEWRIGFNEADKVAALLFRPAE